ncbi:MAG: universal stress protein, partial [Deltaproteobacteria bacterium]
LPMARDFVEENLEKFGNKGAEIASKKLKSLGVPASLTDKVVGDARDGLIATAKKLTSEGIEVEIVIDDKANFIPKAITKAAKKHKAQLIALVTHTGPASAAILGSISRQVVRSSDCPVWSWHAPGE